MDIKKTKEYHLFKVYEANREVNKTALKHLIGSIKEKNMLALHPIVVNEEMKVIDGQHRLSAAKSLGVDIYYIIADKTTLKDAVLTNAHQRLWRSEDYLRYYTLQGYEQYVFINHFLQNTGVKIDIAISLLTGSAITGMNTRKKYQNFRAGDFKVTHSHEAMIFIDRLNEYTDIVPRNVLKDRYFMEALRRTYAVVDAKMLLTKINTYGGFIERQVDVKNYMRIFEDALNKGVHEQNKIRLF